MEFLDVELISLLLKYGSFSLALGILVVMPIELIVYGIMKAVAFFRL